MDLQSSFTTPSVCEVTSKDESRHACWMQRGESNCYDRSYGLRQQLFALILLSQAEWDNKMETRGELGFLNIRHHSYMKGDIYHQTKLRGHLLSTSLSVYRYFSMLIADAQGNDVTQWQVWYVCAGRYWMAILYLIIWKYSVFKNIIQSNFICFPSTKLAFETEMTLWNWIELDKIVQTVDVHGLQTTFTPPQTVYLP